MDDVKSS